MVIQGVACIFSEESALGQEKGIRRKEIGGKSWGQKRMVLSELKSKQMCEEGAKGKAAVHNG